MRPKALFFVAPAFVILFLSSSFKLYGQEDQKVVAPDTAKDVIINNYYYNGYPNPAYPFYPTYPPFYSYYSPRVFVGFSVHVPFHHRVFVPRFRHFRGHGFVRSFGHFRSPGVRGGFGRMRY